MINFRLWHVSPLPFPGNKPGARWEAGCVYFRTAVYGLERRKGKSIPLQAQRCPEGSRNLRFPDYVAIARSSTVHMYTKGSTAEIRTPSHCKLIGHSTAVTQSPSSHCAIIPTTKNSTRVKKKCSYFLLLFYFLYCLSLKLRVLNCLSLKLRVLNCLSLKLRVLNCLSLKLLES